MTDSILDSTKKLLGLSEEYTPFDLDVLMNINSALSVLKQIGIIDEDFEVEDKESKWNDLNQNTMRLNLIKTYVYLKVKSVFDPPATSYLIEAVNKKIEEHEWRLRESIETG